jgi:hypothetical protein
MRVQERTTGINTSVLEYLFNCDLYTTLSIALDARIKDAQ